MNAIEDYLSAKDEKIVIEYRVKNIGNYVGREVVQVYFEPPQGLLGKSRR